MDVYIDEKLDRNTCIDKRENRQMCLQIGIDRRENKQMCRQIGIDKRERQIEMCRLTSIYRQSREQIDIYR